MCPKGQIFRNLTSPTPSAAAVTWLEFCFRMFPTKKFFKRRQEVAFEM
eukprot:UN02842